MTSRDFDRAKCFRRAIFFFFYFARDRFWVRQKRGNIIFIMSSAEGTAIFRDTARYSTRGQTLLIVFLTAAVTAACVLSLRWDEVTVQSRHDNAALGVPPPAPRVGRFANDPSLKFVAVVRMYTDSTRIYTYRNVSWDNGNNQIFFKFIYQTHEAKITLQIFHIFDLILAWGVKFKKITF